MAEKEYQIDIRKKLTTQTIDHFKKEHQQTIMFACALFWNRQTGLLSKNKKSQLQTACGLRSCRPGFEN
ncbi:hypothetical protein [Flavobacterium humidisoli]|uniref:Transposase n=1 Tax=Flavobacterium humidisoli TaxID=2937442 RepID=A0ABY4LXU0_9FLAO|nr:hypothetical protein [Flavobacterium humidisoli]UPZ17915.1 hypothetical protein M0M44_11320 [Flavobacterium humidisoli]